MGKKVVVIGGGTGTYTILSGLKMYPRLDISVIVSMMDDGGSNRVLRDEFGLLPTSDIRQCILALASKDTDETLRRLFTYRYSAGVGISGMTFGNLFMAALSDINGGNQKKAIEKTCEIFGVRGKIIPVTYEKVHLVATYENGRQILGEHDIDEPDPKQGRYKITNLEIVPKARANPDAIIAIKEAGTIILGPGDFYTSVLPNIVVSGIAKAIAGSRGKLIFVMNLMTKFGQTIGYGAKDFAHEIKKYVGRSPDVILLNNSMKFPGGILGKYAKEHAAPVKDDFNGDEGIKIVRRHLIYDKVYTKPAGDKLTRSLIRHDSGKLAKAIIDLI